MANKSLGPIGDIVVLPINLTIPLPVDIPKQIDKAKMSDGSFRWGFLKKHRRWSLDWTHLIKANLDVLIARYNYNSILRWQNLDESADWYNVVITDFSYDSIVPIPTAGGVEYYSASMTLEEAV